MWIDVFTDFMESNVSLKSLVRRIIDTSVLLEQRKFGNSPNPPAGQLLLKAQNILYGTIVFYVLYCLFVQYLLLQYLVINPEPSWGRYGDLGESVMRAEYC